MTQLVYSKKDFTDGVIDLLERGTGKLIGDHQAPKRVEGVADADYFPYAIVYNIPGGSSSGGLGYGYEDTDIVYQFTSVGQTRGQADWMCDAVRRTFCSRAGVGFQVPFVSPEGWAVAGRIPQYGFSGGIDVEGEPPRQLFSAPERFILQVTPVF